MYSYFTASFSVDATLAGACLKSIYMEMVTWWLLKVGWNLISWCDSKREIWAFGIVLWVKGIIASTEYLMNPFPEWV